MTADNSVRQFLARSCGPGLDIKFFPHQTSNHSPIRQHATLCSRPPKNPRSSCTIPPALNISDSNPPTDKAHEQQKYVQHDRPRRALTTPLPPCLHGLFHRADVGLLHAVRLPELRRVPAAQRVAGRGPGLHLAGLRGPDYAGRAHLQLGCQVAAARGLRARRVRHQSDGCVARGGGGSGRGGWGEVYSVSTLGCEEGVLANECILGGMEARRMKKPNEWKS